MKDGLISKLTITKTGHRPSQFKKISDALPVFCGDKNYQGLNEVLRAGRDLVETDFMPAYQDANQWSTTQQVQITTVNPDINAQPDGSPPSVTECWNRQSSQMQISGRSYYRNMNVISRTSPKSTPSSLQTRNL